MSSFIGARARSVLIVTGVAIGLLLSLLAMSGRAAFLTALLTRTSTLGPCEGDASLFPSTIAVQKGQSVTDTWKTNYHRRVGEVIDGYLAQPQTGGDCGNSVRTPAYPALESLAEDLAGWRSKGDLSAEDTTSVLIDYHQAYECSLQERAIGLTDRVAAGMNAAGQSFVNAGTLLDSSERERRTIQEEFTLSRGALRRTVLYLSGRGRLRPLENSLQCFERATLDIRNALSLAADASACLPRIWDVRTSLRTLPEPTSSSSSSTPDTGSERKPKPESSSASSEE